MNPRRDRGGGEEGRRRHNVSACRRRTLPQRSHNRGFRRTSTARVAPRSGSGRTRLLESAQAPAPSTRRSPLRRRLRRARRAPSGAAQPRRSDLVDDGDDDTGGYIAKYNDPPVRTFLSICGCNAGRRGLAAVQSRSEKLIGPVCARSPRFRHASAYLKIVQDVLFQANYYRARLRLKDEAYLSNARLAHWNSVSTRTRRGAPTSCEQKNSSGSRARATRSSSRATASTGPRADPADPSSSASAGHEADGAIKRTRPTLIGLRTADAQGRRRRPPSASARATSRTRLLRGGSAARDGTPSPCGSCSAASGKLNTHRRRQPARVHVGDAAAAAGTAGWGLCGWSPPRRARRAPSARRGRSARVRRATSASRGYAQADSVIAAVLP